MPEKFNALILLKPSEVLFKPEGVRVVRKKLVFDL